jgi:hypothetical protein
MHEKGEGEASKGIRVLLLASCTNAMAELLELLASSGWKERSKKKTTGREGRARGCS